jgi:hypothetical protein
MTFVNAQSNLLKFLNNFAVQCNIAAIFVLTNLT